MMTLLRAGVPNLRAAAHYQAWSLLELGHGRGKQECRQWLYLPATHANGAAHAFVLSHQAHRPITSTTTPASTQSPKGWGTLA